jgi:hypothetical protein
MNATLKSLAAIMLGLIATSMAQARGHGGHSGGHHARVAARVGVARVGVHRDLRWHGQFSHRRWDTRYGRWVYWNPGFRRWYWWSPVVTEYVPVDDGVVIAPPTDDDE